MVRIRYCAICGKPFETEHRNVYCSRECAREAQRKQQNQYASRKSEMMKDLDEMRAIKHPVVKQRKSKIDKINAEAKKSGMTYGQYQAMKFMQERMKCNG